MVAVCHQPIWALKRTHHLRADCRLHRDAGLRGRTIPARATSGVSEWSSDDVGSGNAVWLRAVRAEVRPRLRSDRGCRLCTGRERYAPLKVVDEPIPRSSLSSRARLANGRCDSVTFRQPVSRLGPSAERSEDAANSPQEVRQTHAAIATRADLCVALALCRVKSRTILGCVHVSGREGWCVAWTGWQPFA